MRNIVKQRKVNIHLHFLTTEIDQGHPIDLGHPIGRDHHIDQALHIKVNIRNLKRKDHGKDQEKKSVIDRGADTEIILVIDINLTTDILGHGDLGLDLSQERKDPGNKYF